MQIMADVLALPVRLTQNPEMGIIGAASLARHGAGADLVASSHRIMRDAEAIEPIAANVAVYRDVADRYFDVRTALREPLLARAGLSPLPGARAGRHARALPLVREGPAGSAADAPPSEPVDTERPR
jgi:hypothetical protein